MKIILSRHGKPDLAKLDESDGEYSGLLNGRQLRNWLRDYNAAKVDNSYPPNKASLTAIQSCETQITSDLERAIDSCRILGVENHQVNAVFQEAGFPIPQNCFLKLPLNIWLLCLRLVWFIGYSSNAESFKDASARSKDAANKLQDIAYKKGSVSLVGHGIMNRLIAKQLLAAGWQKTYSKQETKYWGFSVFEKNHVEGS